MMFHRAFNGIFHEKLSCEGPACEEKEVLAGSNLIDLNHRKEKFIICLMSKWRFLPSDATLLTLVGSRARGLQGGGS